jgi:hypothetical protein
VNRLRLLALALGLAPFAACAPAAEPLRVRAADLAQLAQVGDLRGRPVIIEFKEGDMVPIDLTFSGDLLELTPPAPELAFRARRRFFLRIDHDGPAVSLDGVSFGVRPREPGMFRLGVSATPQGARVQVNIKTPVHAPAGG